MSMPIPPSPVDYLIIGHISCDLTSAGPRLGGTAAYSALTGRALGLRVGVVTAWGGEVPLDMLDGVQVHTLPAEHSATFENIYTPEGRHQILHHVAPDLHFSDVPPEWREASIVHVGPIAGEAKSLVDGRFPGSLVGLTPQGWLRAWDGQGRVRPGNWPEAATMLPKAGAAVLSLEDVGGDEELIESMAIACRVLVVTEGFAGVRLYWNGDLRRFRAPQVAEVDATGAGDIFAAAFFWRLHTTRDPWAAARFATHLASFSVKRRGLEGIPTREEIQTCLVEVI
ncbi:MAG TPA: PfkB family carbohydrate kinase [Anaerolineales bacterium]|nr:PfkB family carbohydrate kinase [Anaerolineales bacterium]